MLIFFVFSFQKKSLILFTLKLILFGLTFDIGFSSIQKTLLKGRLSLFPFVSWLCNVGSEFLILRGVLLKTSSERYVLSNNFKKTAEAQ